MIPFRVLHALAVAMVDPTESPEVLLEAEGHRWRARWEGGGRLRALGLPDRYPSAVELAEEDFTWLAELKPEGRRLLDWAATVRAYEIASSRFLARPRRPVTWLSEPERGEA